MPFWINGRDDETGESTDAFFSDAESEAAARAEAEAQGMIVDNVEPFDPSKGQTRNELEADDSTHDSPLTGRSNPVNRMRVRVVPAKQWIVFAISLFSFAGCYLLLSLLPHEEGDSLILFWTTTISLGWIVIAIAARYRPAGLLLACSFLCSGLVWPAMFFGAVCLLAGGMWSTIPRTDFVWLGLYLGASAFLLPTVGVLYARACARRERSMQRVAYIPMALNIVGLLGLGYLSFRVLLELFLP